jgi:CHAD domain-containing protein
VLLRRNFHKMLTQERGVRKGDDPEAIHDMRVATRRIRALLSVIEPVAPAKSIRVFGKELRRIAHSLGDVRDRDVFLADVVRATEHMQVDGEAETQVSPLAPLITALCQDREVANDKLLRELNSSRYDDFKSAFATFITSPSAQFDRTVRLRDLVGSRIWHRYETLRSHEVQVPRHNTGNIDSKALHHTRIAGKHLRYLLEVVEDLPGVRIEPVIDPLVELQDKFGALQDVVVARDYIEALDVDDEARTPLNKYLGDRVSKREFVLADALRIWDEVLSPDYRHKLIEVILKL